MDKEQLEKGLSLAGFNEKEAKVYLACLNLGQDTVFHIAKECGLKRPTVYFVLEKLKVDGFVSLRQTKKASYYSALNPRRLILKIKQRQEKFFSLAPELESIYREQPDQPTVRVFEGKEGVELIYREMVEAVKKQEELLIFGSIAHFYEDVEYKNLLDIYFKEMKNKKYKAREILLESEIKESDYLKKVRENNNVNHQIRVFPRGVNFFENDNMIYGNKIAIFSLKKGVFVILIESKNIAESYRNIFELMWKTAKNSDFLSN